MRIRSCDRDKVHRTNNDLQKINEANQAMYKIHIEQLHQKYDRVVKSAKRQASWQMTGVIEVRV